MSGLLVAVMLLIVSSACAPQGTAAPEGPQAAGPSSDLLKVDIAGIYANPQWDRRIVTVKGRARGWSRCAGATAMITRSDWVLEDATGCVFVTGGGLGDSGSEAVSLTARIEWFGGNVALRFLSLKPRHPIRDCLGN